MTNIVESKTDSVVVRIDDISVVNTNATGNTVVTDNSTSNVVQEVTSTEILIGGIQGPQGIAGDSLTYVSMLSATALSGHRVVGSNDIGLAVYANNENVIGITTGAVGSGELVQVQISGIMIEPTWSWDTALPIYVGSNGVLTQVPPSSGYNVSIGFPLSTISLFISKTPPIILS